MKMYYLILQMIECRLDGVPVTLGDTHMMLPTHRVPELMGSSPWLTTLASRVLSLRLHGKVSSHSSLGAWEPYCQDLKAFPKDLSFQNLVVSSNGRVVY